MSGIKAASLRRLNLLMAGLHGLQAIVILWLSSGLKLPVTGSYLTMNGEQLESASKTLFELPLAWLLAGFLIVAAATHLLNATLYRKRYEAGLKAGRNPLRWYEYGVGAGLMMIAIAMLVGVYDVAALAMIFSLTGLMCLMGLLTEKLNSGQDKINWWPYVIGLKAGLVPWLVVAFYLRFAAEQGSGAPTFVYFIFFSIFIIFSCFAFNMLLHYRRFGSWSDYLYTERSYIWLSLIAKSALAWQIFAGALR